MRLGKSKPGLLLILFLILMASGSARVYIPQDVNQNYPEFASANSNGNLEIFSFQSGGNNYTGTSAAKSVGPIADFDNDSEMEVAGIKSGNNNYQINIYERSSGDTDFVLVESGGDATVKGSHRPITIGNIDNDVYPDILYSDSSGYTSWVDYDTSYKHLNGVNDKGWLGDVADIDRDGYREIVQNTGSNNIDIYNFKSGDSDPKEEQIVSSGSVTKKGSSALADIDRDNYLEYTYNENGGTVYMYDDKNGVSSYNDQGSLSSLKKRRHAYGLTDFLPDGGGSDIETFGAGNNNYMFTCDEGDHGCEDFTPFGQEVHQNFHSYIPPKVEGPEINTTTPDQGMTIQVKFNASDPEGYTDILNYTARANFTRPNGTYKTVEAAEFTEQSGVDTISGQGSKIVPEDGKTKAFNATFSLPDDAETGEWNLTVQVKDEKMTGTKNWTTFQVEKAVIEKNVTQNISMVEKDTSRQTSLDKSQISGLNFTSASLTRSFTNRLLNGSVGFYSGNDRQQSLHKKLNPVLAFSKSASNFKSTFSFFTSHIVTDSSLSDIYSTNAILSPDFGLGSSTPTGIALSRSFDPIINFAPENQAQQNLFRLSENRIYASSGFSFSKVTVELLDYSIGINSSQYRTGIFERVSMEDITLEKPYSNNLSLYRDLYQDLGPQSTLSGTGLYFASAPSSISIGQSLVVTQELFRFLTQPIQVTEQHNNVLESFRSQETSIGASAGISTSQMFFRSFTQPLVAGADPFLGSEFIDGLVNDVAGRIFGQDSRYCETNEGQNNQDDGNGGSDNGGGSGGGSIGDIGTGNNSNDVGGDNESAGKREDEKVSEAEENITEEFRVVNASLRPSGTEDNVEKVEKSLESLEKDQRVVLDTEKDSESSKGGSSGSSTDDAELIEVEKLSFEVEESENNAELDIKTVESPEKLNLSTENDEIYEATRVSTEIDTANATLVYEVEKEFLSRNNASEDEIVVSRWKNGARSQKLPTEIVNESSNNVFVEAYSPKGFSVFTVGLEQPTIEGPTGDPDTVLNLPQIPVTDAFKLLLIVSSLYLMRKPLIVYLSTLDIRVKYVARTARYRLLKYYRRIIWRRKSDVGVEELELTEDVSSLENQKEALKFRKNKLEKEVERKKELRDRYRRSLSLLSEKIEKWEGKLQS